MSGKRSGKLFACVIAAVFMTAAPSVLAFDLATPFIDPLQTLPPIIESGVTLPGDSEPVPCPTCGEKKMRFFCREDTYCVWVCPKCSTRVENYMPELHNKVVELQKLRDKK